MSTGNQARCVIIGASHAGVNAAFALRKEGWQGEIQLLDQDPHLPYHRPPLSKKYLTDEAGIEKYSLKPWKSYEKEQIQLGLGKQIVRINRAAQQVLVEDGEVYLYDKLMIDTGGKAIVPPIKGLEGEGVFTLRHAQDAVAIKDNLLLTDSKEVAIIGGGFIGLELAASLTQLGAQVTLIEREDRVLSRVTTPEISDWFQRLHTDRGVNLLTAMELQAVTRIESGFRLVGFAGEIGKAEMIVVGVGIKANQAIAQAAGLQVGNGVEVNAFMQSSDPNIYAIGDCSWHVNQAYAHRMRLESVQNAVEQAKVAAAHICGKDNPLHNIPWFWSDQFDAKLQMVGLTEGADQVCVRTEIEKEALSAWYF